MEWSTLLCSDRIRQHSGNRASSDLRTEFEKDYHRIIGSASFRRLQDKTQVYPLDHSDFVRTRLTHSLEVSSFCNSLGQNISRKILNEIKDPGFKPENQADVCDILQCAGLLHDIGNPPFGHFGEDSIRNWFQQNLPKIKYPKVLLEEGAENLSEKEILSSEMVPLSELLEKQMVNDFYHFEGNTQALRVVTKLHYLVDEHGMNLTKALLATIIKYPVSSVEMTDKKDPDIRRHKMGYYLADRETFEDVERSTGLNGNRHPLTYVLEAADDIAYLTADVEDAYKKGILRYEQILRELKGLRKKFEDQGADLAEYDFLLEKLESYYVRGQQKEVKDPGEYAISNWMIQVQGKLIADATSSFAANYKEIMDGTFNRELLAGTPGDPIRKALGDIAFRNAFMSTPILKIEIAADHILSFLLETYVSAVLYYDTPKKPNEIDAKAIEFISDNYKKIYHIYSEGKSPLEKLYLRLLLVTDDICGMTDSYAKRLYQELNGYY